MVIVVQLRNGQTRTTAMRAGGSLTGLRLESVRLTRADLEVIVKHPEYLTHMLKAFPLIDRSRSMPNDSVCE